MPPRRAAAIAAAIVAASLGARAEGDAPHGRIVRIEHTPLTDAPSRGPRDAPVTVEVFFAVGTELGNQAYRRATALWRKHPARIRLVFRPLLRSGNSQLVSPIAIAAHARGRFFAFMDELFGQSGPQPTGDAVYAAAERAGLDRVAARDANTDVAIGRVLAANDRLAERARVSQQADLVINGRGLGATPDDATLEGAYQGALELAHIELAAGALPSALPALAARRFRCADARDRLATRRADDEPDPDERALPVTGWHLGALMRDGTDCVPEPIPVGQVDDTYDYELVHRAPRGALLATPLPVDDLPGCGPAAAPVAVHVICSLRNPSCSEQLERARQAAVKYFPTVRVVFHPWADLDTDGGEQDLSYAQAAMCSQRLDHGWRFALAFRGTKRDGLDLHDPAERAGLHDREAFDACQNGSADDARRAIAVARAAGISWSPTVVVGQRAYISGLPDLRPLEDLIDTELAPGLLGSLGDTGAAGAITTALDTCDAGPD